LKLNQRGDKKIEVFRSFVTFCRNLLGLAFFLICGWELCKCKNIFIDTSQLQFLPLGRFLRSPLVKVKEEQKGGKTALSLKIQYRIRITHYS
jgi:hypothetical protein